MKIKEKNTAMSDEDIIKRKLLIDGDGTGDDRRLNVISKTLKKWATSDDSAAESNATHDKLLAQLSLCEYSVRRSQLLTKTTAKQLEQYKVIQDQFEQQIVDVKDAIKQNKDKLVQAKVWKQNHMMYDLLAQNIAEQPARKETNERLQSLQAELRELHKEKEALDQKLEMRKKQFHVLVWSASKLQQMLDVSSNNDEDNSLVLEDVADSTGPEPMSE